MSSQYARYDYAWKTPGWTSQDPVINYASNGDHDPGLPDDITYVRVFGSFLEFDSGNTLEGVLRLRVNKTLLHTPTNRQVMSGPMRPIRFQHDGFEVFLPATDDPQLTPEFEYEARLTVHGVTQEFTFALPAAVPEVNINDLLPVS